MLNTNYFYKYSHRGCNTDDAIATASPLDCGKNNELSKLGCVKFSAIVIFLSMSKFRSSPIFITLTRGLTISTIRKGRNGFFRDIPIKKFGIANFEDGWT